MNTGYLPDFAHPLYQYPMPFLQAAFLPNPVRNVRQSKSGVIESLVYQGSHKFGQNGGDFKGYQPKKSHSMTNSVNRVETLLRPCDFPNAYNIPGVHSEVSKVFREPEVYSRKVFVGGLPIDVREEDVYNAFRMFGKVLVDWPRSQHQTKDKGRRMVGYVFLVFEEEASVQRLVQACHEHRDRLYLFVTSPMMRDKPVQVRPWKLSDSTYKCASDLPVDSRFTVFIGGVPRPTKASDLAEVLNQKYGMVSFVGVDTDPELSYPKGCARVTFADAKGYIAALSGRFVYLNHVELEKRVEIKPYIVEDQLCDECGGKQCHGRYAPYFCGHENCLQYYCESCWDTIHKGNWATHRPLIRLGDQTKVFERVPHHGNNNNTSRHRGRSFARG